MHVAILPTVPAWCPLSSLLQLKQIAIEADSFKLIWFNLMVGVGFEVFFFLGGYE